METSVLLVLVCWIRWTKFVIAAFAERGSNVTDSRQGVRTSFCRLANSKITRKKLRTDSDGILWRGGLDRINALSGPKLKYFVDSHYTWSINYSKPSIV